MWDLLKKLLDLAIYYRKDQAAGKPYWQDPAFVGAAVGISGTCLAKWAGVDISGDLQAKIVGAATGIGMLFSPHTGIVSKPADKPAETPSRTYIGEGKVPDTAASRQWVPPDHGAP
jgi:hypothetical protein